MANRKLQVLYEYRYGRRGVLVPGDRFRVSGGPVYVTDDGKVVPMYERGVFVFRRLCVQGAARWLEAYRADGGVAILWVGKTCRSHAAANLRRRPYRVTGKVCGAQPGSAKGTSTEAAKRDRISSRKGSR
jgi:hypothetical protein